MISLKLRNPNTQLYIGFGGKGNKREGDKFLKSIQHQQSPKKENYDSVFQMRVNQLGMIFWVIYAKATPASNNECEKEMLKQEQTTVSEEKSRNLINKLRKLVRKEKGNKDQNGGTPQ